MVHVINNVTPIELYGCQTLDTRVNRLRVLTRRPSISQLFKTSIGVGRIPIGVECMSSWYPMGPGGKGPESSSRPGNPRLSVKEMDWILRTTAVYIVTNENMATVWATSPHLTPRLARLPGASKPFIHWKNRAITIPRKMNKPCEGMRGSAYHKVLHRQELLRK